MAQQFAGFGSVSTIIEGALLILIVRFAPSGIWPTLIAAVKGAVQRFGRSSAADRSAASADARPAVPSPDQERKSLITVQSDQASTAGGPHR